MPLRRALISAVTLFGGHFLNGRLDRVVLIGALLVVAVAASIGVPYAAVLSAQSELSLISWALKLPPILVGALALLSAGLTFRDAQQPPREPLTAMMRVVGVVLSVSGVLLIGVVLVVSRAQFTPAPGTETVEYADAPSTTYRPFHTYVNFGGGASTFDLPPPPSGSERLRGRITLDGVGLEGVKLSLTLNGKYKVEKLKSDSGGVFEVQLPVGDWRINSIAVDKWEGRPRSRDLVLFSGHEPTKGAGQYTRHSLLMDDGLDVSLPAGSSAISVELELRDALSVTWPPRSKPLDTWAADVSGSDADFPTATIAWQPVEAASEYEVQIAHVTHEGTTTHYTPILMRRLPGLTLPLASLPQRSASGAPADEYAVHVYAFDAEGKLLTESSMDLDDRMFRLTGVTRLGKEEQYSFGRSEPEVISEEYEINVLRLALAAKLLDQKQFDEARRLLDEVTKDAPRGRVAALRGRLAALEGDCVTATQLFDKAEAEGGAGCVSLADRKLCPAPRK
jgi:hypothetical protein